MAAQPTETPGDISTVLGDWRGFVEAMQRHLRGVGLDPVAAGWEMDHICFRCSDEASYRRVLDALVPAHCRVVIVEPIGGRDIATLELLKPLSHAGATIGVIEVPMPKPGKQHTPGLEHAEFVIGTPEDGFRGDAPLRRFMAECKEKGLALEWDLGAAGKERNADVTLRFDDPVFGAIRAKFHARPLLEVCRAELAARGAPQDARA
eukprot:TRINITY_DN10747_c0_g1_i1.p3 TRINITY_DN10747_c0_g1~~TRINITY_DN10747_c0_g1_i1.p3  ORF type:complete len:230 (+),score=75.10 TRINITY_DN10747_c0_g1_i1:74-691(+)